MYLLRAARLHRKVLLFRWDDPEPVETFLEPARIDWSTHSGGLGEDVTRHFGATAMKFSSPFDGWYHDDRSHPMFQLMRYGTASQRFQAVKVRQKCTGSIRQCMHHHNYIIKGYLCVLECGQVC
jgi:hypothetical protein